MRKRTAMSVTAMATMLFAGATAAACASDKTEQKSDTLSVPAASASQPEAPTPTPDQTRPTLALAPRGAPAGSKVTVSMGGLVLHAKVDVGFGGFVEHQIIFHDTATVDGNFKATVTVPADTKPGAYYFFLADTDSGQPFGRPQVFLVTAKDGTLTIAGKLTDEGAECRALRTDTDEVYTLAGAKDAPPTGTDVIVQGTIAERSTCMQGITIAVKSIRAK